ncbi:MAG: hypothetical protein P1P84_05900 [Deferrisomatales bacterium]|nr:hypothetical protein [Deferrisomatales bacterium]
MKRIFTLLTGALALATTSAWALTLGSNITIYAGAGTNTNENGETEPGMVNNQAWDLEAFLLHGNTLSLVGGYNFKDGHGNTASGDTFIDIYGSYGFGKAPDGYDPTNVHSRVQGNFGYESLLSKNANRGQSAPGPPRGIPAQFLLGSHPLCG